MQKTKHPLSSLQKRCMIIFNYPLPIKDHLIFFFFFLSSLFSLFYLYPFLQPLPSPSQTLEAINGAPLPVEAASMILTFLFSLSLFFVEERSDHAAVSPVVGLPSQTLNKNSISLPYMDSGMPSF